LKDSRPGRRGKIPDVARVSVIRMGVRYDRSLHRKPWVNIKISWRAKQPLPGRYYQIGHFLDVIS
jgi:hypothetical protein